MDFVEFIKRTVKKKPKLSTKSATERKLVQSTQNQNDSKFQMHISELKWVAPISRNQENPFWLLSTKHLKIIQTPQPHLVGDTKIHLNIQTERK